MKAVKQNILVVEDDEDIQELIAYNLEKENYKVTCASSGSAALKSLKSKTPDLIILDLMLPDIDGLTICKQLKRDPGSSSTPVLMLTAKSEEADIVAGLEIGADDYITKPFSPRIMLARVRAVLRRKAENNKPDLEDKNIITRHEITIDPSRHRATVGGKEIDLTYTEFRILHLFCMRPGIVFERYEIVDRVKGEDYPVTDRAVDVQIACLRKKLGRYGSCIETVRGIGYRFKEK